MRNLRSLYNIYRVVAEDGNRDEEYIETLEFNSEAVLMKYLNDLKAVSKQDFTARLSMLLTRDTKGAKHGKQ
jgi:hypothetical protein